MFIEVFKSKIHRVTVTASDLNYIGSITIDEDLIEAAGLVVGERVYIVNVNNGERFDTYVIKGKRKSGEICLNGPAARKVQKGDVIIIISYAQMSVEEAQLPTKNYFPRRKNQSFNLIFYILENNKKSSPLKTFYNLISLLLLHCLCGWLLRD
jgi:aspartate 1-decarboxylase